MQRKLTAILSADVVGYSGMMEVNESGTLERLKANRTRIFDPHVTIHGGRLFKLLGDGALVEFPSVIAAVDCALAIQDATNKTAENDAKPIRYRIGINSGEVIVEGDDIYGEGVNVAARIQALAPVGGVAVSRVVRDQVLGKTPCAFEDMGEHSVKNIEAPVHVFSVRAAASGVVAVAAKGDQPHGLSVCVLPFTNMSDDPQQEYFSDGISEDIITDLSKVSALFVISRNNAFMYKGKHVDIPKVARELKVTHVLEGSVRKAGGRVRITAQLIDGAAGGHVWAERYDRDLNDIFAIQDEISEAIVAALKLKLLPEEKKAIEHRGTESAEAYNLYLMARQTYTNGSEYDTRRNEAVIRLCKRATEIDPGYAMAWTLMALGKLRTSEGRVGDTGLDAAERALALNSNLAEAHAVKSRILAEGGQHDEASAEIAIALRLAPDSYEVNRAAGYLAYRQARPQEAVPYYEKALALVETEINSAGMLVSCYIAAGDREGAVRVARIMLARVEKALARDQDNGTVVGYGAYALSLLGELDRAKEWIQRATLIEPENWSMRYNFACVLANAGDKIGSFETLETVFTNAPAGLIQHSKSDPDLEHVRADPRFAAMLAAAEARFADKTGVA
jgi:adenylate cyclase